MNMTTCKTTYISNNIEFLLSINKHKTGITEKHMLRARILNNS